MDAHEASKCLDQHGPVLLLLARQIASEASAQDIVQEAFLRFWRSRQRAEDPVAYLYACTRHCAMEFRRAERRRLDRERATARDERLPDYFVCGPRQEERRLAIEAALRQFPEEQRQVVIMKIWGGLTFEKIAEVMGGSPNTAASRYRYALDKLRRELSKEHVS